MNLTEQGIILSMKKKKMTNKTNDLTILKFPNLNLNTFSINNYCLSNIQHLSLLGNSLKELTFINFLPNLWFLDIRKNSVNIY